MAEERGQSPERELESKTSISEGDRELLEGSNVARYLIQNLKDLPEKDREKAIAKLFGLAEKELKLEVEKAKVAGKPGRAESIAILLQEFRALLSSFKKDGIAIALFVFFCIAVFNYPQGFFGDLFGGISFSQILAVGLIIAIFPIKDIIIEFLRGRRPFANVSKTLGDRNEEKVLQPRDYEILPSTEVPEKQQKS